MDGRLPYYISCLFALFYVIPSIVQAPQPSSRSPRLYVRAHQPPNLIVILALLSRASTLDSSLAKPLVDLSWVFHLSRMNVANYAAAKAFDRGSLRKRFWLMGPTSRRCACWSGSLLFGIMPSRAIRASGCPRRDSANVPLELTRLNREAHEISRTMILLFYYSVLAIAISSCCHCWFAGETRRSTMSMRPPKRGFTLPVTAATAGSRLSERIFDPADARWLAGRSRFSQAGRGPDASIERIGHRWLGHCKPLSMNSYEPLQLCQRGLIPQQLGGWRCWVLSCV